MTIAKWKERMNKENIPKHIQKLFIEIYRKENSIKSSPSTKISISQ